MDEEMIPSNIEVVVIDSETGKFKRMSMDELTKFISELPPEEEEGDEDEESTEEEEE